MKSRRADKGNAMLFVLIAIILFAALSFAFTRGGRDQGKVSKEDATIYAQQITSYAEKINNAVQNAMLQNNFLASQLSFENTTVGGYANAGSPVSHKCDVFDAAGGGMTYAAPPAGALDAAAAAASAFPVGGMVGQYLFAGNVCADNIGTGARAACATDTLANEDLVLIVPFVNQETCIAINRVLGNSGAMMEDTGGGFDNTKFTGSFADGQALGNAGFTTYPAGCYKSAAGATPDAGYHFYYTLVAQ